MNLQSRSSPAPMSTAKTHDLKRYSASHPWTITAIAIFVYNPDTPLKQTFPRAHVFPPAVTTFMPPMCLFCSTLSPDFPPSLLLTRVQLLQLVKPQKFALWSEELTNHTSDGGMKDDKGFPDLGIAFKTCLGRVWSVSAGNPFKQRHGLKTASAAEATKIMRPSKTINRV